MPKTSNTPMHERYSNNEIPWDSGRYDKHLKNIIKRFKITPGKALDFGCGTGTNVIWLNRQGFNTDGYDYVEKAIKMAKDKARNEKVKCHFKVADILKDQLKEKKYSFIFDRGCFHTLDGQYQRSLCARNLHQGLKKDGIWLSIIGSADCKPRAFGPPVITATEIAVAVEPWFEILLLEANKFDSDNHPECWLAVMKKR